MLLPKTYREKLQLVFTFFPCSINMSMGRSTKSAHSESRDVDDGTELEKDKLLRQYRIMDGDRQAYSIQARQQMHKQQQEIDKLRAEQEELKRKLGACKSLSHQKKDKKDAKRLHALMEHRDSLEVDLEKEVLQQKEIQKEISSIEMKLKELRKKEVSTGDTQKSAARHNQKAVRTLENKLEGSLTRFNEQLTKNSRLREELQTLHIERVRFQRLHDRLVQEIQEVRKKIGEVVTVSTVDHDARVEAQSKLSMMREKADKESAQYNTEMRELERVISHECGLKDFITTKYSENTSQDDEQEEAGPEQVAGVKEQGKIGSSEESQDDLEAFFERIRSVTGEDDLDLLVTRFMQAEDRNFALFNFVNEQNNEAEVLRDQISQIQEEMERFRLRGLKQEEAQNASLRDIDVQEKEAQLQAQDYDARAGILSKVLEEIETGVSSIFSEVASDPSAMEDPVSDSNLMSYLGVVEQKANELLTIQAFLDNKEVGKEYNTCDLPKLIFGRTTEMLQENLQASVQSVEYDVDDLPVTNEEERPLSQWELRRRILEGVTQRESRTATKSSKTSPRVLEETL
ncbi:coiled-coil domain-containing protein 114 isoform X2 [Entelurus aequoreus]|uniref:coiled-coil domain-containing protein 114 isoform X2 n=1 Tax=Entelurus aequoreus TaxID=161455 RepID=UPI002B1D9E9B|nr:coiled-coil domain-containing protein 114 isoform X2 [Entelurus aequoreus]